MQAPSKSYKIILVALIASFVLSACGGGATGSTWFNLPSIPVTVQPDGSLTVFGYTTIPVLDAALIQQFQAAGVNKMEVRIGYNGIQAYSNGNVLPYLSWDAASLATLQDVIRQLPNIPNGNLIASVLPLLRTVGLGVALNFSPAAADAPRWNGDEANFQPTEATTPAIGPFQLGGIAFDQSGNLSIGSVPGSALGLSGPLLDANTLGLLQSLGLDKLQVKTESNGLRLSLNDRPLPGIAYDAQSLENVKPIVAAFAPGLAPTLETVLPNLPATQLDVAVSFTGEPAGPMQLANVPVVLNSDGSLSAFGVPLPGATVPADILQKLQAAGVQALNVDLGQEGLFLAANGQTLPTITWTPETLNTLANVVAPLAGLSPELISNGLTLIQETGGIKATVGVGAAAEPAEINKTLSEVSGEGAPVLRLNANVQNGAIQSVEGLGDLAALGVDPVALPPNVLQILTQLGASQVQINTDPGHVNILLDGNTALTLNWDQASLQSALQLAGPFLAGTPLEDPNVAKLVNEQIVPLLPGADVDVTLNLQ